MSDMELMPPARSSDITRAVDLILCHPTMVSEIDAERLLGLIKDNFSEIAEADMYGPDFNMTEEINTQLSIVKALRNTLIDKQTGNINSGYTIQEASQLLRASSQLTATLMKFHTDIIKSERQRAVEQAVIAYASTLPEEQKDKFMKGLQKELEMLE